MTKSHMILLGLAVAAVLAACASDQAAPNHGAAADVNRQMTPYIDYGANPQASDDLRHTNTYGFWKDRAHLDPKLAADKAQQWKTNWKFMDPPFDDSMHGGHLALDRGEALFKKLNAKGDFAACLGATGGRLEGVRLNYPKWDAASREIVGLEAQIERCAKAQGAQLDNGSYDNSAVSVYVTSFSNGLPFKLDVTQGPLKEAFERGRKLFHTRAGWTNFSCATCHTTIVGQSLRGQVPTTHYADVPHWPTYRTKDELQSLHVRFAECNRNGGVQPLKIGSKEYHDLEVFMSALSRGYPVAVPSARD